MTQAIMSTGVAATFSDETLPNGLRLLICEDHLVPAAAVVVSYGVGARNELAGQTELSHLFEHLMFDGSVHLEKGEHFKLITEAGGIVNAMTSLDHTVYFQSVPAEHLELAIWLEAERLANLRVTQEGLDNQREVVWNEHRQRRENMPYGSSVDNMMERLFPPEHPYHMSMAGHAELADATLEGVVAFFDTHYAPNNAVMAVLGDVEPERVRALVERYLGALPRRDVPAPPVVPLQPLTHEQRATIADRVPVPRVYVGWRAPVEGSREYDALEIAVTVLGTGQASRLRRRLVHELELASDVGVALHGFVGGASLLMLSATARSGASIAALEEALHETVLALATEPVTAEEMRRARALLTRQSLDQMSSLTYRGLYLTAAGAVHGDPQRVNSHLDALRSVDPSAVQDVAAAVLRAEQRVVLTYLPDET